MKTQNWLRKLSSLFLMMTIMLSVAQPGLVDTAFAQSESDENIAYDPLTGALAFVGSQPGKAAASPLANPLAGAAAENATAFAATYGQQLGLSDVSAELAVARTSTEASGRSTIRYQQNYQGIPIFGGEVIVNTDAQGSMLSLTAKTSPNLNVDINPTLTVEDATVAALEAVAKYNEAEISRLTAGEAKLQIYDSRLLNPDGIAPRLVWNMTVSDLENGINEVILVDAQNGAIALHYNQMDVVQSLPNEPEAVAESKGSEEVLGAPQIGVYNLNHAAPQPSSPTGWPGAFICNQSNKTACDGVGADNVDATNAYKNAMDAYNFMKNHLKIDSFDNAGVATKGSINYGTGYKKNFWVTGIHAAVYGTGYTGADDMAGHAIGFGLLEYSDSPILVLTYQPGAIAESLSDMWGEFIDQTNGRGNDTAAVKWAIGEDWPAGQQRNMKNPAAAPFNHADKMSSPNFYLGDNNNIGIYINAGVNNKAVYLMTDGGTFNGKTITALGISKVARIYYEAEKHLLGSASTYFDLYYAVKQACHNLVASGLGAIAVQDCDQVRNALDAVQMNLTKSGVVYPVAQFCPPGKSKGKSTLFTESFEAGTAKWILTNPSSPSDLWKIVTGDATTGRNHFEGPEPGRTSNAIAQTANPILIPGGYSIYLFFEHRFSFESMGANYHDGGVLYYSPDNGVTWKSAAPLFASGQTYNGTIATGQGNPIQGQPAFVSFVRSYVGSSYNLTSLAGKQVKFRWLMSSDAAVSGSGWYLDNIQVYRCVGLPGIPTLVSPAANAAQTTFTPTLRWSNVVPDLDHYVVQVSTSTAFTTMAYQAASTTAIHTLTKPLQANKTYYWRVRAYNASNDGKTWSAVRSFRTTLPPPTLISPNGVTSSLKPTFDWSDVWSATGYIIQIVRWTPSNTTVLLTTTIPNATSRYTLTTQSLVSGQKYYWRVLTRGVNGNGAWSAVKWIEAP